MTLSGVMSNMDDDLVKISYEGDRRWDDNDLTVELSVSIILPVKILVLMKDISLVSSAKAYE